MIRTINKTKRCWVIRFYAKRSDGSIDDRRHTNWANGDSFDEVKAAVLQWEDMGTFLDAIEVNPNTGIRMSNPDNAIPIKFATPSKEDIAKGVKLWEKLGSKV